MRRNARLFSGFGKARIQRTRRRMCRPYFLKEILDDQENAFTVGVGPGGCSGRLRGLRAVGWRSGLQGELPELSRLLRHAEPGNRKVHGGEGGERSGIQERKRG